MSHASSKCMWLMLVVVVCSILVDAHAHDDEHTPHHRCVHDELMQLMREERGNAALPLVRTGANVVGAALADGDTEASTHEKVWAPIRIKVFTPDLHPRQTGETSYCSAAGQTRSDFINSRMVCTKDDILTDEKRQIIEELLVPAAVQLHQERLLVEPTVGPIHIPYMSSSWSVCGHYNIPRVHASEGVFGADFILYISSVPTDVGVAAWAITCFNFNGGRPAVAVANINPRNVGADRRTIRTLAHEILHGLGFYYTTFTSDKMVSMVSGLRGRPGVVPLMTTQPVIEAARTHFQCDDMIGMELESDGGSGTMGSHWKRRNAKDELMAPVTNYGGFYTALTIAAMESFPFYKGNYSNAETMGWGHNAGCTLFNEKCVENGVSHYPSMFCADKRSDRCNSNRFGLGYCTLADFTSPLPSYYRYFSSPITGGSAILMEYCPIVQMYSNGGCETGNERVLRGSILSSTSRCLDAPSGVVVYPGYRVASLCAEVKCDNAQHQYSVLIKGSTTWVKCPVGGVISPSSLSKVFVYGEISCPPFKEVCQNSGTADRDASSARSNSHSQPPSPTKEADSSPTTTSSPDSVEKPSIASKVLAAILLCGLYIALLFRLYVLTMM